MESLVKSFKVDALDVHVCEDGHSLANLVAEEVRDYLESRLHQQESVRAIFATGNSQIQFLERLAELDGVDWTRVRLFHMDEYLGIPADHAASFRHYMKEKVEARLEPQAFHYLKGDSDLPLDECERYERLLQAAPIDLCCLGIGENGHLAFNDPHVANFEDPRWVKLVRLDDRCKLQQVQEGHFPTLDSVPSYAFTLTIPALCSAAKIICVAPEKRKAEAVKNTLQGPLEVTCPASYLRTQSQATLYLDQDSCVLLDLEGN